MKVFILATCLVAACSAASLEYGARQGKLKPTQLLKSYQGFVNDFHRTGDTYQMEYHVGDSHRFEQRSESGEVTGQFSFVAPNGDEFEFKYDADSDGNKVEGDALPKSPDFTDDVKAARDAFFELYEKQAKLTEDYSDESSEEDDDEESSEEDDDEESSEEDDDDTSEEDDDDDDDDEEEDKPTHRFVSNTRQRYAAPRPSSKPRKSSSGLSSFFNIPS